MKTIIVGGGWAGLAAAVELSRNNVEVIVLESARQLGGRARSGKFDDHHIDNGQHIMLGAYTAILNILETIGIPEEKVFRRLPLYMEMMKSHDQPLRLKTPPLPAPLHLLFGLLSFKGMKFLNRISILHALVKMRKNKFTVSPDIPLSIFLKKARQSVDAISMFWEPLCISVINLPPEQASSQLFMRVMRDAFFSRKQFSDLLLPISDLGTCLPQPAMEYIEKKKGSVQLATRVTKINIAEGKILGITAGNNNIDADNVIIATHPGACEQLLLEHKSLQNNAANIHKLGFMPICTLYLKYPESVSLPKEFVGMINTTTQWLFDRESLTGEKGLVAAVISGPGKHTSMTVKELTDHIIAEIAQFFPGWPKPIKSKLIREKRATISAIPGCERYRPDNATVIQGLWLAGDYTDTGYPSTLEGAVRSGVTCAQKILEKYVQ